MLFNSHSRNALSQKKKEKKQWKVNLFWHENYTGEKQELSFPIDLTVKNWIFQLC